VETGSHPLCGALALGALLAQAPGAPVGPASEGTKRFELEVELTSPGATAQFDVEDGEHRGEAAKVGGRYALTRTLVVTDEALGASELRRRIDELAGTYELGVDEGVYDDHLWSWESHGCLEGFTLRLVRGGAGWDVAFEGRRRPVEPLSLDAVRADVSLRAAAPPPELEPGGAWTIDAADLPDLLFPGGLLPIDPGGDEPELAGWGAAGVWPVPGLPTDAALWLAAVPEGEVRAVLASADAGATIATMRLEFDVELTGDSLAWIRARLGERWSKAFDYHRGVVCARLRGAGTLRWDRERDAFERFDWEAAATVDHEAGGSFLWDAPRVTRFQGSLIETWTGTLRGRAERVD